MATTYTSIIDQTSFNAEQKAGVQYPSKVVLRGGGDAGKAINANQIDWGSATIMGEAMTNGTTQRVFEILEDKIKGTTDPTEIWETYDEELEPANEPEDEPNGESGNPTEPTPVND